MNHPFTGRYISIREIANGLKVSMGFARRLIASKGYLPCHAFGPMKLYPIDTLAKLAKRKRGIAPQFISKGPKGLSPDRLWCPACETVKNAMADFYASKGRPNGRQALCKECQRAATAAWKVDRPRWFVWAGQYAAWIPIARTRGSVAILKDRGEKVRRCRPSAFEREGCIEIEGRWVEKPPLSKPLYVK